MTERVLINVRVKPESKARIIRLAARLDLTLSDVARMAMAKGLDVLEQELR